MPHKSTIRPWSKCGEKRVTPNASFRARSGDISINLATQGNVAETTKAYVQAYSGKGDINVNLYSLQEGKHVNLHLYSHSGEHRNILLLHMLAIMR